MEDTFINSVRTYQRRLAKIHETDAESFSAGEAHSVFWGQGPNVNIKAGIMNENAKTGRVLTRSALEPELRNLKRRNIYPERV